MSKLEEKLKGISPSSVVVIEVPLEDNDLNLIAEFLRSRNGYRIIYICTNRPTTDLVEKLAKHDFDLKGALQTGKICVIDLVSRGAGAKQIDGVIYVPSLSELSATQMAIEKAIERITGEADKTWLLLDSVSTLLVFNDSSAFLQFLHYLIARLRVLRFGGVIFTFEHSVQEPVRSTIRQFCDSMVKP